MKKIIFLSLFSLIGFFGTAQLSVGNSYPGPLWVTVQYSNPGSCFAVTSQSQLVMPGGFTVFNAPAPGMVETRVDVVASPGLFDSSGVPCICPGVVTTGLFTFSWNPGCSRVMIN